MSFSPSDWILLGTALIIAWYTYETYRIRKETSKQNTLLAEQLLVMQQTQQLQTKKDTSFIKPLFLSKSSIKSAEGIEIRFFNKGGPATKLIAKPLGKFTIKVSPSGYLGTDREGRITITGSDLNNPDHLVFELEYRDNFDGQHRTRFSYNPHKGQMIEDENGT